MYIVSFYVLRPVKNPHGQLYDNVCGCRLWNAWLILIIFIYFVLPSDIAEKFRNASRHTKQLLLWFVSFVYRRTITPERYSCHGFTSLQFSVFISCISLMSSFAIHFTAFAFQESSKVLSSKLTLVLNFSFKAVPKLSSQFFTWIEIGRTRSAP